MTSPSSRTAVVAGCGNIGSRLLQSLGGITQTQLDVYGLEPYAPARALSTERFAEANAGAHRLHWLADGVEIPTESDLAIVSVDAKNRLLALEGLLELTRPRAVLLEKVLFTKKADYARAKALLDAIDVPVFVNTSRNLWPSYHALKAELPDTPFALDVDGRNWGMGSNAIHFLTLAEYLSGSPIVELGFVPEGPELDAKRSGYREFTGTFAGRTARGDSVRVHAGPGEIEPAGLNLVAGGKTYRIDEVGCTLEVDGEARPFPILYTSQISDGLLAMMERGESELPTLAESTRLHMLMFEAFAPGFGATEGAELAIT